MARRLGDHDRLRKAGLVSIQGLHHVQLAMPAGGESDAEAFYSVLLGLPRVPRPPDLERRGGCWFRSDAVEIHLGVDTPFAPARKAHPALLVDNLPALRDRLVSAGVPVADDEPLDGFERFYGNHPFGNRLEFLARRQGVLQGTKGG